MQRVRVYLTGWYLGHVETWWGDDGILRVGFKCDTCGKMGGHAKTLFKRDVVNKS